MSKKYDVKIYFSVKNGNENYTIEGKGIRILSALATLIHIMAVRMEVEDNEVLDFIRAMMKEGD